MKYKNTLILIATAFLLTSVNALARGNGAGMGDGYHRDMNSPHHKAVVEAMENNDYAAWRTLMEKERPGSRVLEVVNEGNFQKFAEAHRLMSQGKFEEAQKIRSELGLGLKKRDGKGHGKGMGSGHHRGQGNGKGKKNTGE